MSWLRMSGLVVCVMAAAYAWQWPALAAKGDPAFGEYLASQCTTCHQRSGRFDGIPPIVGWPRDVFVEIMLEYKTSKRESPVMRTIAARLSQEEIEALAAYYEAVK